MKSFIKIIFFLLTGIKSIHAQDTAITITPGMYNPINEILIGTMEGWYFKEGNDSTWSGKEIDITGWKKLKPTELSVKLADKNGKLEGWFRLKVKPDTVFKNTDLGLRYSGWAAADIYIDGNLIQSHGNTGVNGNPFEEFNPSNRLSPSLTMEAGIEHTLAIHFVDYVSTFPPYGLKSEESGLHLFIRFIGPSYYARFSDHIRQWPVYGTLPIVVCAVLGILFWFLAFLNPKEKNLRLFAACATFFTLQYFCNYFAESNQVSFITHKFFWTAGLLLVNLNYFITILIAVRVFNKKLSTLLKFVLVFTILAGIVNMFSNFYVTLAISTFVPIIIYVWYIFSSWKKLNGAQWAIVVGLLSSTFFFFLFVALVINYRTTFIPGVRLVTTMMTLAFPLSLLAYVAIRFKEIIQEVRQNAARVVQLSEEKREQALKQQKLLEEEVQKQTIELRTSLENLKSTQSQLIQSEKMASLGELTAGIAHEIQNPLNFVNNFSEVNTELIAEMKEELNKGNFENVKSIANDIDENEQKVILHGKRADAIVKSMLQHSRSSTGKKEPTDLNALVDEYLRLAYHGLRAKDKSFNVTMKTGFDENIGKINIIPQDIGRGILNLITNAFYAVTEKKKQVGDGYEPIVSVSTKKINGKVEIKVKDNGNGISQKILDKIFQPFFTTKPTGQGTGLGLSLSYDIIKSHGGELRVVTKEEEGSEFIILLPQ